MKKNFSLTKIESHEKMIQGELSKKIVYTGEGYDIIISTLFGDTQVKFVGLRDVGQPQIVLNEKNSYISINNDYPLEDINLLIEDIHKAKELIKYVKEHLEELNNS